VDENRWPVAADRRTVQRAAGAVIERVESDAYRLKPSPSLRTAPALLLLPGPHAERGRLEIAIANKLNSNFNFHRMKLSTG